ncbi:MAG: CDP-alcohol phosphatidyltransferase family protein [Oscillospiraceae bacterium]|nr:CDP-alcohol phosphatidyltransferase family protein [Oscillospiraceae bacterium]
MKIPKHLPNLLSFSRIPLSILLPFLVNRSGWFVAMYVVTGLTDILDGQLARKHNRCTDFGAKLDGFADIVFTLSCLVIVFGLQQLHRYIAVYVMVTIGVIAALKVFNLVFGRVKFRVWSTMHTRANKLTTLPFFFVVPVLVVTGAVTMWLNIILMLLLTTVLAASGEETLILLRSEAYDANTSSVFALNKRNEEEVSV